MLIRVNIKSIKTNMLIQQHSHRLPGETTAKRKHRVDKSRLRRGRAIAPPWFSRVSADFSPAHPPPSNTVCQNIMKYMTSSKTYSNLTEYTQSVRAHIQNLATCRKRIMHATPTI